MWRKRLHQLHSDRWMRIMDVDRDIDLWPGPLPHRREVFLKLVDARGCGQAIAGAEMHLQAAKAPFINQNSRRVMPDLAIVRFAAGWATLAVGPAGLDAKWQRAASGAVHADAITARAAQ